MNQGTPEQSREIRRRRKVFITTFFVGGLIWFVGSELFRRYLGDKAGTAFLSFYWLFGVCALIAFVPSYFCCPVCNHSFPRGSNGKHCANCDTDFEL